MLLTKPKQMYKIYTRKPGMPIGLYHKILLVMRLTTVILLATLLQVSASTFGQRITMTQKNAPLEAVLKEIRKQSGYNFYYDWKAIPKNQKISVSVTDASLNQTLDLALKGLDLSYEINGKSVSIKASEKSFFENLVARFRAIDVKGKVLDENGAPLVGATVAVKGTNRLVKTDINGVFFISGVDEQASLVITYIGYEAREVDAASDMGSLTLNLADAKLEEVKINAGYYSVTDRERTGSISRITSKDIEKQPVNNVLAAMQANLPGVEITQNTGVPGGGFKVQIRGQNSISSSSDPYYIIDGVPFEPTVLAGGSISLSMAPGANPLASINPYDIESIEILKDADATAIYGSRGANGVVLITTKKGKTGDAKTSVSLNQGVSRVAHKMQLMNTQQYLAMRNEAFTNDKLTPGTTDYDVNGTWDTNRYTDWQRDLIGGIAPSTNIMTSISGGSNSVTYLIGGAHYKEGTVFLGDNSYARNSGNFSLQYTSNNKKFNASVDANYSQINSDLFLTDLTRFITLAPNYPSLLGENGSLNWGNNTMIDNPAANTRQPYNSTTKNLIGHGTLSYSFIKDLTLKTSFGYTTMDRKEVGSTPLTSFSPIQSYGADRRSYFTNNSASTWIMESLVDWSKQVGSGKLSTLLGITFQQNLNDRQELNATGYTSDALLGSLAAASTFSVINNGYFQYRYTAAYGRLNYNLYDKYIINATGRRDGSTRFGTENRFANFGAIGGAWIISNETLIHENVPFISFAKIRGSYGITGNDRIPDYGYLELWNNASGLKYQGISILAPSQLANPEYAWEVSKKVEGALDIGMLKDRLNLSVGYYSSKSSNLLLSKPLTPSTGFLSVRDNLPATVGNTGWEFSLNSKNVASKSFSWVTSFNLTIPKNKLISYPGLETSSNAATYAIGYPLAIRKLFANTLDSQTGLYVREDLDLNGTLDAKDQYIIKLVGRKFYGGLQNSFTYKGIQLDFLVQFVKQSGSGFLNGFNAAGSASLPDAANYNQPTQLFNRWQSQNDNRQYQKFSNSFDAYLADAYSKTFGGLATEDASYIRLKNLSIAYNLPTEMIEKVKISGVKIFLQGQNLFTITGYKGLDPETQTINLLPTLQVITAGIQVTF
jgi:TonB-linked SusC/RagA family outer membrane protein